MLGRYALLPAMIFGLFAGLSGCADTQQSAQPADAITEVAARSVSFNSYPTPGTTYLVFDRAHGFQVNYLGQNGKASVLKIKA